MLTGASQRNWNHYRKTIYMKSSNNDFYQRLLSDPQTSGGLIISVKKKKSKEVIKLLRENKFKHANIIGEMKKYNKNKLITVI